MKRDNCHQCNAMCGLHIHRIGHYKETKVTVHQCCGAYDIAVLEGVFHR